MASLYEKLRKKKTKLHNVKSLIIFSSIQPDIKNHILVKPQIFIFWKAMFHFCFFFFCPKTWKHIEHRYTDMSTVWSKASTSFSSTTHRFDTLQVKVSFSLLWLQSQKKIWLAYELKKKKKISDVFIRTSTCFAELICISFNQPGRFLFNPSNRKHVAN